ncbi:ScbR family autoregulator-binding transcription factor [Streptomyces erythrochromogenes]|uniref:ScbR family autoregulator-binding transcription factor n=1 Tax=Streptomyces erythrochromogenes TaxID=285574 RepID=UPI0036A924AE
MAQQERAVRTRETLIKCAAETFTSDGFAVASLTTISRRAGVSNGALHFHFATKAALADAVEVAALIRLRAVTGRVPAEGWSALQHVVDVTHGLARGLREDVVLRAGFELSGGVARPPSRDLRDGWQGWVEEEMARAAGQGELRPGVTVESAVTAVVAATVGFEVLGARRAVWTSRRTVTQFWQLILPSLASEDVLGKIEAEGSSPLNGPNGL